MRLSTHNLEGHNSRRTGWLRAAVLGANDGIVSTGSLLMGVAAANSGHHVLMLTGIAGLVAGAMSMAAGEYVSVHTQTDTEQADIAREKDELANAPAAEQHELAAIYVGRGLDPGLAKQVAIQLIAYDAVGALTRDELGITKELRANPMSAAFASAMSFFTGAALPIAVAGLAPPNEVILAISLTSMGFLALLGAIAAHAGGAPLLQGAARTTFWGAAAMVATAVVGWLLKAPV